MSQVRFEDKIDPELLDILKSAPALDQGFSTPEELQTLLQSFAGPQEGSTNPDISVENRTITSEHNEEGLLLRIYQPASRNVHQNLPALLWMHAGGMTAGSVYSDESLCERIALESHCIVVSVGYRLAPQDPYPVGLDDCYAALTWLAGEGASELCIQPSCIAVGGCSGGGCLAAGLALRVRDQGGPVIDYQLLVIPTIDDRLETPSSHEVLDARVLSRAILETIWAGYLSKVDGEIPAYAVAARAMDLTGLPPAFISVEELDPQRDEGIIYAQRLMQADVPTELHVYPGTFHGSFMGAPEAGVSKCHVRDIGDALKRHFAKKIPSLRDR